jgi:SAM-dependent methyltransferase
LLNDYSVEKADPDHSIKVVYDEYTTSVSTPIAAISLELACVIWFLLNKLRPKLIVDLGSGFSSYLFRLYQQTRKGSEDACQVFSCDDNSFWLEQTRRFVKSKSLSVEGLLLWDEFMNEYQGRRPDLVLYDLGSPELRVKNMSRVFDLCGPETTLILDDIQKPRIKQAALDCLEQRGRRGHDLARLTYDNFGRYAWMIHKVTNASRKFLAAGAN